MTDLTAADRCDRCGARALHRYLFAAGELMLCAHHEREHQDRLPHDHEARCVARPSEDT